MSILLAQAEAPAAAPEAAANEAPKDGSEEATDAAPKEAPAAAASEPAAADLVKAGQQQFMLCGACHGQQGEGTAAGPPLAGSEWVNGPAENLIKIQFRGLTGPIKVKGQEYDIVPGMMPMAYQTDEQIAGVLSYVRSNFGNDAPPVTVAEVAALRDEVGKPQITASELTQPESTTGPATTESGEPAPVPEKYKDLDSPVGAPGVLVAFVLLFIVFCFVAVFRK